MGPRLPSDDLTLMTSVTPLRSSISWNKIDHPCVRCPSSRISRQSEFGCSTSRRHGGGFWMAPHSSALGTVCLPGTWPPNKPVRGNLKDVSLSGCDEKVATPNATCLTDLRVSRLPPEPSEAINTLSLAHTLKPLLSHILTSEHSASSLAGNRSRGKRPRASHNFCASVTRWSDSFMCA